MNTPLFAAEIKLFDDVDEGLRIECSEKHAAGLKSELAQIGATCGDDEEKIKGTTNIHSWVAFSLSGIDVERAKAALRAVFARYGVTSTEESFVEPQGESEYRFYLNNVSVIDKRI